MIYTNSFTGYFSILSEFLSNEGLFLYNHKIQDLFVKNIKYL